MREAKFKDIFEDLHRNITDGEYPPGTLLPSLPNLAGKYATSRPTIRKALQMLEEKGLVVCRNGIGVAVTDPAEQREKSRKRLEIAVDISPHESNYFNYAVPIMNGLVRASEKYGFILRLIQHSEVENWKGRNDSPDGLILHTLPENPPPRRLMEQIADSGIPLILLNRTSENPRFGVLSVDYRKETRRAVSCMIRNGAKRIALYKNPPGPENALHLRVHGWRDAYLENGLAVPGELCITAANYAEANRELSALLAREIPDMIFITNGTCFYQVCTTLAKQNLSVPDDVALLCFDDIGTLEDDFGVPASYIRMPLEQMGFEAAESIVMLKSDPLHGKLPRRGVCAELIVKGCKFLLQP